MDVDDSVSERIVKPEYEILEVESKKKDKKAKNTKGLVAVLSGESAVRIQSW